mgnify:CR=1 FL=1
MKIAGEYSYPVPRETLWQALLDPSVLQNTLPGCEELVGTGENRYHGKLKMKVGPVQGVFEGDVELSDLDPPNGYTLTLDGKGAPGFVKGRGTIRLDEAEDGSVLHYEIDAQVGGRVAAVGQRLLDSSAKVITRQGLEGLERQVVPEPTEEETEEPEAAEGRAVTDEPPPAAPSQSDFAKGFARGMYEELVPKPMRPVLAIAALLIVVVVVAVVLRACG